MGRLTDRDKHEQGIWAKEEGGYSTFFEHYDEGYLAISKLARYEDMEEQGRLIELPCAVGDTVYRTNEEAIEPYPYVVFSEPFACFVKNLWGKEFFATKEEAKAKLKELEGVKE